MKDVSCDLLTSHKQLPNFSTEQFELALSLHQALSIMYATNFENSQEILAVVGEDKFNIIKTVVNNLRATLQTFITVVKTSIEAEQNVEKEALNLMKETKLEEKEITTNTTDKNLCSEVQSLSQFKGLYKTDDALSNVGSEMPKDITKKVDNDGSKNEEDILETNSNTSNVRFSTVIKIDTLENSTTNNIENQKVKKGKCLP